jgi:predicted metal-dependent peptidase
MGSQRAYEVLTAGRLLAKTKAPYFRALLLSFVLREVDKDIQRPPGFHTIGVTDTRIFIWDPQFVESISPEEMAGGWLHEAMHCLNKHGKRRGPREPRLWNLAGDLAINPTIIAMGAKLPGIACFPAQYKQADGKAFPEGLSADDYYELLLKNPPPKGMAGGKGEPGEGDENDEVVAIGKGFCGSCAGRPFQGEPDDSDPEGRSEGEMDRTIREVAEEIEAHARSKGIGSIPAGLRRWAEDALKPAVIPWREKLAVLARRAVAWRPGAVDHRYDGPSRRQAGIGYGVGRPVLPRLRSPVPRVAIAVDTSGSMGQSELIDALTEAQGILKAVGAEVEFIACDAEVHENKVVTNVGEMMRLLKGGGGTDFRPVFERLNRSRPRPEVVIFATDGYGPAPATPPPNMKTVWLLVGGNEKAPAPWGDVVVVKDDV